MSGLHHHRHFHPFAQVSQVVPRQGGKTPFLLVLRARGQAVGVGGAGSLWVCWWGVDPLVRIVQMVLLVLVPEQVHYSDHRS